MPRLLLPLGVTKIDLDKRVFQAGPDGYVQAEGAYVARLIKLGATLIPSEAPDASPLHG